MVNRQEERLFEPDKIEWLLGEGLETMDAGDRQMLLVMAETKVQDGYKPTSQEKQVVEKLRALAGQEYDAQDIKRKVKTMVKGSTKADTAGLTLPKTFEHLLRRLRTPKQDSAESD
jgi:metal-dependent amidase/aminoacylase/carboxypeptidase family protein